MINDEDVSEWIKQIELAPASAPLVVKKLGVRLKNLDETNEKLRNENIQLRESINTKSHETEVNELHRQIRGLTGLIRMCSKKQGGENAIITWSDDGKVLVTSWNQSISGITIKIPSYENMIRREIRLLSSPIEEEILFVTNKGKTGTFIVKDLVTASHGELTWHKLPSINLDQNETVAIMTPIALLPLCESFVTASYRGYVRNIPVWSMSRFLQTSNIGRGSRDELDSQAFSTMIFDESVDILLFTRQGGYIRFPASDIGANLSPAAKLSINDYLVGMVSDDQNKKQILLVDKDARGVRRPLLNIMRHNMGLKPKNLVDSQVVVGAALTEDNAQVVFLCGEGKDKLMSLGIQEIPSSEKGRTLSRLPLPEKVVHAFATMENN